jgi:hypothetical protein
MKLHSSLLSLIDLLVGAVCSSNQRLPIGLMSIKSHLQSQKTLSS